MPESTQNRGESQAAATKRGIRWDAVAAIIASLVGLLALLVAGYSAYIQHYTASIQLEQVRAQVWPYLEMSSSNANGEYEFFAVNKGAGPVIVKSVQVLVSGKPASSWKELFPLLGFKPSSEPIFSTLNQTVLATGEKLNWIVFKEPADVDALRAAWARFDVEAKVCYSSTLGENWLLVYQPNRFSRPRVVQHCPRFSESTQFSD